jgi:ComF family protein
LPVTNFHFTKNEAVKKILYGRVLLEEATALLYFSKGGMVQQLLHHLKYKGHEQIGAFLGEWLGEELKQVGAYDNIDFVLPVPLHKKKLRKRGFNQVTKFGMAIAKALDATYKDDLLLKRFATQTQVFKSRLGRFDDSDTQFFITESQAYANKHLLLVDDIITTGATVEKCAAALQPIPGLKLSVATMAIAE